MYLSGTRRSLLPVSLLDTISVARLLAVTIIVTQIAGDVINVVLGDVLEGAIGIAAAGALLAYLLKPSVRAAFRA